MSTIRRRTSSMCTSVTCAVSSERRMTRRRFRRCARSATGAGTATNRPELFARGVPDDGESAAAQATENRSASVLLGARDGYSTQRLADVGEVRLLKRALALRNGQIVSIGVAEPLATV